MTSVPERRPHSSSCSTAAARKVSAAASSTPFPDCLRAAASLPVLVVLPEPLTPSMSTTLGSREGAGPLGLGAHPADKLLARLRPEIRGEQKLLQLVEHGLVDLTPEGEEAIEPLAHGLAGPLEPLAEAVGHPAQEAHHEA